MTISAGARLGAYEVLEPLGAGGMGEVYRARDPRLGREVALKVLPEALAADRDRIARFEQEARAASALNHPNIVTIHEIGREGNTAFIAMELVDGKTLRELSAAGAMPVRKILGIAAQVAEGLAKAHGAGIVHRDLKPENVMVSKDGFVKILDFGLAKLVESESGASAMPTLVQPETYPGTVMGTVGYMSPEQASGEPLDFRSDQFSFGSMLYEMTTGRKAFQRKTAAETLSAIIRDEPEPLTKLRPDLPPPVRWILERCLAKDREDRYASTKDLARDLASVRDHISEVVSGAEAMASMPASSRGRAQRLSVGLALLALGLCAGWALTRGLWKAPSKAASFQRLTFRRGLLGNARFTPDGQSIVYSARWGDALRLYLTRPESPESQAFEFGDGTDILSISRTGELALLQNPIPGSVGTLAVAPLTGGLPRRLIEGVPFAGADWAPNGKDMAVVREVEGASRLEFPVGKVLIASRARCPRFAPAGDLLAFFEVEDEASDAGSLAIVDTNGKSKKLLSSGWVSLNGVPAWTADGREIWFTAAQQAGRTSALWAVDRSGRHRLVMRVPGQLELYDIARDGRVLLAHHTITRSLRGLGVGQAKELELSWLDDSVAADISSDGKTLLINENGEGAGPTPSIYLRGMDGSAAVRLGDGEGLAISPDGKWVLGYRSKPEGLVLLPTGAGPSRNLDVGGLKNFEWGAWLPDGESIVFAAAAGAEPARIYVQAVADGKPHPISPPGVRLLPYTNPVSPDGKQVVATAGGKRAIYPIDGTGQARVIAELSPDDLPIQWSSDSLSLYFIHRGEQPTRIWLLDLATGQRQLWKELPLDLDKGIRVRLTPDGKSYVRGGVSVVSELYLVEGLR
jgi:Tol biopolymer transport system component